jgi:hypothetical protein
VIPNIPGYQRKKDQNKMPPFHIDPNLQKPLVIGRIFLEGSGFTYLDVGIFPN